MSITTFQVVIDEYLNTGGTQKRTLYDSLFLDGKADLEIGGQSSMPSLGMCPTTFQVVICFNTEDTKMLLCVLRV